MKEYDYKVSAAGRINVIGEHIDYCGGKVMPAALGLKNTDRSTPKTIPKTEQTTVITAAVRSN